MQSMLKQSAPWRKGIAWWIVLLEGLLTLGMGVYIIFRTQEALKTALFVIGGYLVVTSILHIAVGIRRTGKSIIAQFMVIRGVIGFVIGLIVMLGPRLSFINAGIYTILAIGFLISGLIGLYGSFLGRKEKGNRQGNLLSSLLNVALAILLFYLTATSSSIMIWIGWIAIVFGILLTVYSIWLLYNVVKSKGASAAANS